MSPRLRGSDLETWLSFALDLLHIVLGIAAARSWLSVGFSAQCVKRVKLP